MSCLLGFCVWYIEDQRIGDQTGRATTALAAGSIYLLAALCYRVQALWSRLYQSPDIGALTILPVPPATIFRWEIQRFFRDSICGVCDLVAILGPLAVFNHFSLWQWAVTALYVAAAWLSLISLTVFCLMRLPLKLFQMAGGFFFLSALILVFGRKELGPPALHFVDAHASEILVLLPTGWPIASSAWLVEGRGWWAFGLLLPASVMIFNLRTWLAGLRATYEYQEFVASPAADLVPGEPVAAHDSPTTPRALGPTEIEEIVAGGSYLAQPATPLRHFPEKVLWAWLTPRQKALAEFVHPTGMAIGTAWRNIYIFLLATCVLAPAAGAISEMAQWITLGLGALMVFSLSLATFANHGRAFRAMWGSGVNIPLYASFGISFRELGSFFWKHSVVQLPPLTGAWVILGGLGAWCLKLPVSLGLFSGLKLASLMFAGRFMLMVFAFSSGTNDTSRFRLSAVLLIFFAAAFSLAFMGLGTACLLVPEGWRAALFLAGASLVAWLFFLGYGWLFRSSRFDLMSLPRQ